MGFAEEVRALELLVEKTQLDIQCAEKECRLLAELIMRRRYRNLSDSKPNLLKERKKRKKSESAEIFGSSTANIQGLTPKAKKAKSMENMGTGSAKRGRKPKALMPSPVAMTDLRTVNQLPPGRPQADNGDEEDNDEAEYFENDDN